ncbi:DUF2336 domain-containing protein [Rhodobacteraceae bacterium RKSG542]|uniref:DUF2336 domain-containing protein n=1 Tax=Pseudovibrio flavus TaxID=2529854 RepID=UPI0012BBE6A4|nr:DUF2336 domain-containing protein [Pseudovibrio flavus]MTI19113.1 DUF2336 domain-containing protein [Pseudovibrio flavus]
MTFGRRTELVDFNSSDLANNKERQAELAQHVTLLFSRVWERCSQEQIEVYDQVLLQLSALVEMKVRIYMAQTLASIRRAPEQTVRALSAQEIEVAEPLLAQSTCLRESDLLSITESCGDDHRFAIAGREILSEALCDALICEGSLAVQRRLAANEGALLSHDGMDRLLNIAEEDELLQSSLGERADLAEIHIDRLIDIATSEVRARLIEKGQESNTGQISRAARVAAQRLSNEFWLGRFDFETAEGRVLEIARKGRITEHTIRQMAEEDRFPEAVAAMAVFAGVGMQEARHWMVRQDVEPFLIMCKAVGLNMMTLQALLKIGPWRFRLSNVEREVILGSYQKMEGNKARASLNKWLEPWVMNS